MVANMSMNIIFGWFILLLIIAVIKAEKRIVVLEERINSLSTEH